MFVGQKHFCVWVKYSFFYFYQFSYQGIDLFLSDLQTFLSTEDSNLSYILFNYFFQFVNYFLTLL